MICRPNHNLRSLKPRGASDSRSCDSIEDDLPPDAGEAKVAAPEAVGEQEVVEAELVKHGGVEIVDVHGFFLDAPPN